MFKYLSLVVFVLFVGCSQCQGCGTEVDAAPQDTSPTTDGGVDAGCDSGSEQEDAGFPDLYERVCDSVRVKAF